MSDVYVYVTEDVPPPLSTSQIGDRVNVDWSAGQPTGVEVLGAVRVTVDGADVAEALSVLRDWVALQEEMPEVPFAWLDHEDRVKRRRAIFARARRLVAEHTTVEETT